ncbi:putative repeat protein (TIGR01451 family) [Dokdonella fugitiva]|uniref:Putative repeat protein (TIGR01451 family) n=1 Tax=Dokdonella fugitiva TaxID=328517 RepID=A0A839FBV4_9GAMM|nr:choice-of-anchor D domain-containing protein [Dokdonella fugitiva]MBA8889611.1 putative repeat protein (TIGR01451 family) [Dokdonella fugitiva]
MLFAVLASLSIAHADPDPFVFESHAPGDVGGGLAVGVNPVGITFRLLQRTELSEIGIYARGNGTQSVYGALYRIATPDTVPDVAGDSRLVGTTLLQPSTTTADVAGPLAVTLEPGWYAITTGTGRYGATASTWAITLPNVCATWPCPTQAGQTVGPYTVNATTNARSLQGTTVRIFARGQALPPSPSSPTDFLVESARVSAWKSTQTSGMVSPGRAVAVRFAVDRPARVRRVSAWMFSGSGSVYAAIVRIAGPTANTPFPATTAFTAALAGSAVFDVGSGADEYGVDLPDIALAPGSYALVIGSGLFGAGGSALMLSVVDQVVIDDALLWNSAWGPFWAPATPTDHYAVRLAGVVPELAADPVAFGDVPLGVEATRAVTLRNLRAGDLHLSGIALGAGAADGFALDADAATCANVTLPAQGECTFSLHFTPVALGAQAARIDVASDGVPATFAVAASGNGIAAWTVTPSAGAHGSIAPATPQVVGDGGSLAFTLAAEPGYHVDVVGGSCGGMLAGTVYTVAAVHADCTIEASFALDPATAFTLLGGSPQSTAVDTAFAASLDVRVTNAAGIGVPGTVVAFAVPTSGASALVAASAQTDADGIARVDARANTIAGRYDVSASVAGLAGSVAFELENLAGPATHVAAVDGAQQSTVVETAFAAPLAVRVSDAHDNPVGGAMVAFTAPASGASANVSAAAVATDADGRAAVAATANAIVGGYAVVATVVGTAESASFALQNLAPDVALALAIDDGRDYVRYGDTLVYDVVVSNHGSAIARDVDVAADLPAGIDANAASWSCIDAASGACGAGGSGALLDHATVAANGSVHYLLAAPVRADAPGATIEVGASTTGVYAGDIANATDTGWLVVFRDGFEAKSGD